MTFKPLSNIFTINCITRNDQFKLYLGLEETTSSVDEIMNGKLNAECFSCPIVYYLLSLIDLNTLCVCLIDIYAWKIAHKTNINVNLFYLCYVCFWSLVQPLTARGHHARHL